MDRSMVRRVEKILKANTLNEPDTVWIENINTEEELNGKCSLFSRITLKPGIHVGYHRHEGDIESYFIISGQGLYNCNGIETPIEDGYMAFCRNGDYHDITNTGETDLVMIALIVND